jgi:hypothetical protein
LIASKRHEQPLAFSVAGHVPAQVDTKEGRELFSRETREKGYGGSGNKEGILFSGRFLSGGYFFLLHVFRGEIPLREDSAGQAHEESRKFTRQIFLVLLLDNEQNRRPAI